jgi:translation initiation factor 1 (eIF-1/SUI1)
MKKLGVDEIFILSAIADKIGEFKFPERNKWIEEVDYEPVKLTKEEIKAGAKEPKVVHKGDKVRVPKTEMEYGIEAFYSIFRKIHLVEPEVRELITIVSGKDSKDLSIKELVNAFKEVLEAEGIMDFFKSADS